jgi:hypothetical protein
MNRRKLLQACLSVLPASMITGFGKLSWAKSVDELNQEHILSICKKHKFWLTYIEHDNAKVFFTTENTYHQFFQHENSQILLEPLSKCKYTIDELMYRIFKLIKTNDDFNEWERGVVFVKIRNTDLFGIKIIKEYGLT